MGSLNYTLTLIQWRASIHHRPTAALRSPPLVPGGSNRGREIGSDTWRRVLPIAARPP